MAKEKRSFLSKLIGEDEEVTQSEEVETEEVELHPSEMMKDDEEMTEPVKTSKELKAPGAKKQNEDWLNEYEGQLTIDVYQTKDSIVITSTIAGVRPEDIDISIANDMVTIKGDRKKNQEVEAEDYFYQECYWGSFSRSVILPVDIDPDNVQAELKDGILIITLSKAEKSKTRKIKVMGS